MSWEWECVGLTFRWRINVYPFLCSNYAKVHGPSVNDFMFSCWAILADQIQSVSHSLIEFHETWYIQSITSANRCCDSCFFLFVFFCFDQRSKPADPISLAVVTQSVCLWRGNVMVSRTVGMVRMRKAVVSDITHLSVATDKYANADAHTWTMNYTFIYLNRLYI